MSAFQSWPRPIRICAAYLSLLGALFAWFWIESDGGRVDASAHRTALYVVYLLVFPVGIAAFLIHLLATIGTPGTLMLRIAVSALSGCLGILVLHLMVKRSPDGEAAMAYLAGAIAFGQGKRGQTLITVIGAVWVCGDGGLFRTLTGRIYNSGFPRAECQTRRTSIDSACRPVS